MRQTRLASACVSTVFAAASESIRIHDASVRMASSKPFASGAVSRAPHAPAAPMVIEMSVRVTVSD